VSVGKGRDQFVGKKKMEDLLVLDPKIRDWVLIPILCIMLLVSILRQNITKIIQSPKKMTLKSIQERFEFHQNHFCKKRFLKLSILHSHTLQRSKSLRNNGNLIPEASFQSRRAYFTNKMDGIFSLK